MSITVISVVAAAVTAFALGLLWVGRMVRELDRPSVNLAQLRAQTNQRT